MEHSILNGGRVIVICAMTLWLLFRVRKLHSQFGIINAVYCLGIILVILCAAAILIGPMNLENIYHDIKHPPEPEQIESSPMRELLAGETTLLLDNRGCGYIPGDIVIINGDTSQIRPGDC
ncbi:MAG TPA: hypothetical protein PKM88_11740, partial [bacterium]|nr:hypothetical protein [bacterium]